MQDVKAFIIHYLERRQSPAAAQLHVADDTHLLKSGLLDSFGFLDLLLNLEKEMGVSIDFSQISPDQLLTLGALRGYVERARQA